MNVHALSFSLFLSLFLPALHSPSQEAEPATQAAADPTLCCRIKEGDKVNVDVTAPGATLALALMFLRTNNASVADRLQVSPPPPTAPPIMVSRCTPPISLTRTHTHLQVPETNFMLAYVRPDLVLLRVLARNLVMWDSIVASDAWIDSQARLPQHWLVRILRVHHGNEP